jgi:pre-mRNA-splicing factor CWC22
MLNLLLENTTDNGVELAIELINECKQKLAQVNQHQLDFVFTTLRNFLREASLEKRTKYMIEIFFAERKDQFETNPVIQDDLDLLNKIDQFTHIITLVDTCEPEIILGKYNIK